jgi:chromosome segregation ATPase
MKATQLEAMREIHEMITKERECATEMVAAKSQYMPVLEQELFEWEEKYKKCQSVDKLNQKIILLYKESSWASVIGREKRVEEIERDIGKIDREIEKNERRIEEATRRISEADERRENNAQKIARLTLEADSYEANREELSGKYKEVSAAYRATNSEIKKTKVGENINQTLFFFAVRIKNLKF